MLDYFKQADDQDANSGTELKVTNKLKDLASLRKDIRDPSRYETANMCHIFHNRLNLSGFLANHVIEGADAQTWIGEGLENFVFPSLEVFFCLKHENAGKIESHLWFFKGLCNYLNPRMCQLIDAGSIPLQHSISRLFLYMDSYGNVGGCCGEIEVFFPKHPSGVLEIALIAA